MWSAVNRLGTAAVSFTSNLVLARLLTPDDFGCVGMLMVFIAVAGTIVDSGFDAALIQKPEPTATDYSTVLYLNVGLSVLIYAGFFLCAPAIAALYKMPSLTLLLRVLGLSVVISSLAIVQNNQFQKQLRFERIAAINVTSTSVGALAGIGLALAGTGVWSLVVKTLVNGTVRSLLCWRLSKWRPVSGFSAKSAKELFGFGGMMLLTNVLETAVTQLIALIIGRSYSARQLGYYSQAVSVQQVPETTIPFIIQQVFFPVYAALQRDLRRLVDAWRSSLRVLTFLNFPIMVLLILTARPLMAFLLGEQWEPAAPYFQILCVGGMAYALNSSNYTILQALGLGKEIVYASVLKRCISIVGILIGMKFGVYGIVWGGVLSMCLWFPINAYWAGKATGYGFWNQVRDVWPSAAAAAAVGVVVYGATASLLGLNGVGLMCVQALAYCCGYGGLAYVFSRDVLSACVQSVRCAVVGKQVC